ncbi:polyhomeotic-like protein 2 isoform 2-T2 [Rhinophrynus dorsalis]
MYLRAQMLIFTPTAAVTSVQSEVGSGGASQSSASSTQVQNLAVRGQHGATGGLSAQSHLPSLAMKPTTSNLNYQPATSTSQTKPAGHLLLPGIRGGASDISESHKKGELQSTDIRGTTSSRTAPPANAPSIITPTYTQQLMQKQVHHQFVIQHQMPPRSSLPLTQVSSPVQPLTHQPQVSQSLSSPPITSQAPLDPQSNCSESNGLKPSTSLQVSSGQTCLGLSPKLTQEGQEPTAQHRVLPHNPAVILQIQAPQGTTPPPQDHSQKLSSTPQRNPSTSPCQTQMHPIPALLAQNVPSPAAAPNTDTPDLQRPLLDVSSQQVLPDPNPHPALDMTSGNGQSPVPAPATGSSPQNGENKPPQAVVKPQILTHIIEGFVIQEGAQPFPVGRSSLLVAAQEKYQQGILSEKLPQPDNNTTTTTSTTDSEMEETFVPETKDDGEPPKLKCELCGRVDFAYKFKRSKRFCSMACAKRYNVGCTKRVGLFHPDRSKLQKVGGPKHGRRRSRKGSLNTDPKNQLPASITPLSPVPLSAPSTLKHSNSQEDSSRCSDNSSYEEPLSPISASSSLSRQQQNERDLEPPNLHPGDLLSMNHNFLPSDPTKWNVEDVYEFIRSLPGCQEISEEFRAQEIDGQALLLLKEDHLMSTMNIKLGPALKIYARISMLKDS